MFVDATTLRDELSEVNKSACVLCAGLTAEQLA